MGWWRWLRRRVEVLFRKKAVETELDEEIRFHLEMEIAENLRAGMSPPEARRQAMLAFGGADRFKEEVRNVRGARFLDDLVQDTRVALRSLPKTPAFLVAVVITLAVGIAGSVAMFAVLDSALLKALPYPEGQRLVLGRSTFRGALGPYVSAQDFEDYRARASSLEAAGAIAPFPNRATVTGLGEAERIDRVVVSADFFQTLGVDPVIGRHFLPEEATRDAPPVTMLSHGYWQRRFGSDPDVVGRALVMNGIPTTVVGVMPEGFRFYLDTDVWQPYHLGRDYAGGRQFHNFLVVGRLAPGATLARARAEVDAVSAALALEYPSSNEDKGLRLDPLRDTLVASYLPTFTVLAVGALLILIVACANVAGLLLARGSARRAEMAVRSVMGAGGGRLARQLLTENALLATAAGGLGVLLGFWIQRGVLAFLSLETLGDLEAGLSSRTLGAAVAISAGTALLSGMLPSLRVSRIDPAQDLRGVGRTTASRRTTAFRNGLVVTQIALTSVLLAISGLLARSFLEIREVDLGFDARNLVTAEVQVPSRFTMEERRAFFGALKERAEALPGVTAVAMGSHLPVRDPGNTMGIQRADAGENDDLRNITVSQRSVLPGYFEAMGIPVLAGRPTDDSDRPDGEQVIVLSESTARHLFGDEDPVGRQVEAMASRDFVRQTVVGVVGDVVLGNPTDGTDMAMYFPHTQLLRTRMRVGLRVQGDATPVVSGLRRVLQDLEPNVPLDDVRTMDTALASSTADRRAVMAVLLVFGATSLILACVGLYGVLAYRVSLRLREIGIRMAVGASARTVTARVVRSGLVLVAAGYLLGAVAAVPASRVLEGMLFGVGGRDPLTFAAIAVVLAACGVLACGLPARRAARISPADVMRSE